MAEVDLLDFLRDCKWLACWKHLVIHGYRLEDDHSYRETENRLREVAEVGLTVLAPVLLDVLVGRSPFDDGVISAMDTRHRPAEAGETETLEASLMLWKENLSGFLVHRWLMFDPPAELVLRSIEMSVILNVQQGTSLSDVLPHLTLQQNKTPKQKPLVGKTHMNQSSGTSREADQAPSCKIDRVAADYDLATEAERLAEYWTRDDERKSLRELAVHFNHQLLRAAMEQTGLNPLEGEVENTYRLLTDEDVSQGMRTQARNRLQKQNLDVDQLQSDFVSYGTVRRHLKGCLGVEREPPETDDDPAETGALHIAALQNRTVAVTENTLSQLASAGELAAGDIDVFVDITISCPVCGMHAPVREYIERNGCDCAEHTSE